MRCGEAYQSEASNSGRLLRCPCGRTLIVPTTSGHAEEWSGQGMIAGNDGGPFTQREDRENTSLGMIALLILAGGFWMLSSLSRSETELSGALDEPAASYSPTPAENGYRSRAQPASGGGLGMPAISDPGSGRLERQAPDLLGARGTPVSTESVYALSPDRVSPGNGEELLTHGRSGYAASSRSQTARPTQASVYS